MWHFRPLSFALNSWFPAEKYHDRAERPWQVDSQVRSLAKAFSYRAGGLAVTVLVVWAVTGKLELAAVAGTADTAFKVGLFYFHERIWNRISFGLKSR